jgi:transcriptional/translational regulatory protein YebC/TACO1
MPTQNKTEDDVMNIVLESGAEDLQAEEDFFEVQTSLETFEPVRKALVAENLEIENASLQWIAKNNVNVAGDEAEKVMKLIEALEESDDVQNVYSNADFDEDMIK